MREPRNVIALYRDGPGIGPVTAVQDAYGKAYQRCSRPQKQGEIISKSMHAIDGTDYPDNFQIMSGRIHPNTIYAILRRSNRPRHHAAKLEPGHWYETHGD